MVTCEHQVIDKTIEKLDEQEILQKLKENPENLNNHINTANDNNIAEIIYNNCEKFGFDVLYKILNQDGIIAFKVENLNEKKPIPLLTKALKQYSDDIFAEFQKTNENKN